LNLAEDFSALVRNFLALPQTRQFKREQTHPRRLSAYATASAGVTAPHPGGLGVFVQNHNRRVFVAREQIRWVFVDGYAARVRQTLFREAAAE
jgi:hypothetical protein